ncbi:MAG TPA: fasciclin domain-containing protein [Bacteroidales bacterium]|nr:fasciclin domain-containing protein [Bacteroidales bacterium]
MRKNNVLGFFGCLLVLPFLLSSCLETERLVDNYKTFTGQTIKDFLDSDTAYSKFERALDKANALSLMASYGKYTCFVPDNQAMDRYVAAHGFTSFTSFLDSVQAVRKMVFYHLIDGESNQTGTFLTAGFNAGSLETKNMIGRYLYTTLSADGTNWLINNNSKITSADHLLVNGVVHLVDKVVEGNDELLPDYIENDGHFNLYDQALKVTGLRDSLLLIEDEKYKQGTAAQPSKREYGYTALLETDSLLALNGITDLAGMSAYAAQHYPGGAGLDFKNPNSSLYRFVAYHLLPVKLTSSQLCPTNDFTVTQTFEKESWQKEHFRDGRFSLDNYWFPMATNTVLNVQIFKWRDKEAQKPVFNDARNPYDARYTNMTEEVAGVVTLDLNNSNLDCLNGVVHTLTGMLVYDETIYHKRIRMDFSSFFSELWNNDLLRHSGKSYLVPLKYCKNITYDAKDDVYLYYYPTDALHSHYWGDQFMMFGRCNTTITIGPIPSGSYEVRIGYHVRQADYGIVQYYLDGEPCGIPLDQTKSAKNDASIGWTQVWWWRYGGGDDDPVLSGSWLSGSETEDDFYGYDNDKSMHNRGYMKAPDSYAGKELANNNYDPVHVGTARNDPYEIRRVLKMVTWNQTTTHQLRISALMNKRFMLDYIEFMPKDLLEDEDAH